MRKIPLILILLLNIKINSQQINPLDFFPYHTGDLHQYVELPSGRFYQSKITNVDTSNTNIHYIYYDNNTIPYNKVLLDSAHILADSNSWFPLYKLNCERGSYWLRDSSTIWWVHYKNQYSQTVFNETRLMREYHVYEYISLGDTNGLPGSVEYLVEGIGLYKITWEGGELFLIGCIINGIQYGTIIGVNDYPNLATSEKHLLRSYPNPFNNSTIIQYSLPEPAQVSIKIYDIIGNEVKELFYGIESYGVYSKMWKPETESSGIYFVVLRTNKSVITHKLLYLK